jgi:hypothetical protein
MPSEIDALRIVTPLDRHAAIDFRLLPGDDLETPTLEGSTTEPLELETLGRNFEIRGINHRGSGHHASPRATLNDR